MHSSPRARASPSVSGSTPSSLNDLFVPPSPVPDRSRKSARLASQDAGSVRTFLAARGVVPDDFLLVDPPADGSGDSLRRLKSAFSAFGVPLSEEKTVGPATALEFLGIRLDTRAMVSSLPLSQSALTRKQSFYFFVFNLRLIVNIKS
uniref:Uncharacterized protein n=1 Tax=Knipowitschia caucasica TaxID=637954 RepID=A0AAV2MFK7_KNICA